MQNLSNGEYISNLSSEINAKNNLFSQRKKKIHNNIAHFRQISNDIQNIYLFIELYISVFNVILSILVLTQFLNKFLHIIQTNYFMIF